MRIVSHLFKELAAAAIVLSLRDYAQYLHALVGNIIRVISLRSLRPADTAFMKRRSVLAIKTSGKIICLKEPDFALVRELYGHRIYFPEDGFIPPPKGLVVDLGANVGLFSILCAKLGSQVIAVEAQGGFISMARDNIVMNGVTDNIRLVHAMVGASTGVFSSKDSRILSSQWIGEPMNLSMDDLLCMFLENRQQMIYLLKIDIEGSEFALFDTNPEWIDRMLHISMEVHPEYGDVCELSDRIQRAGFTCKMVPSWREKDIPQHYPGFLFARRNR